MLSIIHVGTMLGELTNKTLTSKSYILMTVSAHLLSTFYKLKDDSSKRV